MTKLFKNLGKAPSQIHTPNLFEKSLNETKKKGRYEESQKELAPLSYQEANYLNFQFAKWFALLYHVVSVLLGLATVVMLAYLFSGLGSLSAKYPEWIVYGMFGVVGVVLTALLIGIEIFKGSLQKSVFRKVATGEKVGHSVLVGLFVAMIFSIGVSAVGGAILSFETNDKSTEISQYYQVQKDSLQNMHQSNLSAVNASIEAYKANLNKGSYWAKYATREKLDKAIEKRNELLTLASNQINLVQNTKDKEISKNLVEGKQYAWVSALVVFFLEILSLLAYKFIYAYHANCQAEAVNFAVLSPTITVQEPNNKTDIQALAETLQSLLNGGNLQLNQLTNSTAVSSGNPTPNKVGFMFSAGQHSASNGERLTVKQEQHSPLNTERLTVNVGELKDNERVCLHCGNKFVYKHWNAKYCGETCRITAWEVKTGKKFKKMKKDDGVV